ncbi:MAG: methionine--tRNA ligase [Candidatus Portiera sp.]|nr:methionine--tRNA ligase [Portiera sp.]
MSKKILVTNALPYANGDIHLGHLMEHIQTNIWVRFQRLIGKDCTYVCADDAHGTATSITADKLGKDVLQWIDEMRASHIDDFAAFSIKYDNYYSTHSDENRQLSEYIYHKIKEKGYVNERKVRQLYDEEKGMFLADRFIKGTCPSCDTEDQYGDNCEACGSTYDALDLKEPRSLLSDAKPIIKESEHLFLNLKMFEEELQEWMANSQVQSEVSNKLQEWFDKGLREWNISRDAPYFGWLIPGYTDKYFYVWLDAPIGYMASLQNLCQQKGWDFDKDFWRNPECEIYHFIGKDIIYFHALFWPALLQAAEYNQPTGVFAHGFLTVNGAKMSKSRGTFILAKKYLQHLDPQYLRYYFAAKMSDGIEDMDFNTTEFSEKVNSDLVGKYVNIASRCARFINRDFGNKLGKMPEQEQQDLLAGLVAEGDNIAKLYNARKFSAAMRSIMELADRVNKYIGNSKPWELAATDPKDERVQQICTTGINCFRILTIYLLPVLPDMADKVAQLLNIDSWSWQDLDKQLIESEICDFSPLLQRVPAAALEALLQE